jgi:large subunit ribosomal protein L21
LLPDVIGIHSREEVMYALVDILGKQYKVEQGSVLRVDHVPQEKGAAVEFPSVLMVSDAGSVRLGSPYLPGVSVRAVVEDHGKAAKVLIGKFKKKKNYRRRQGHREQYSTIKVEGFNGLG